jgi:hypothetical protein
MTLMIDTYVNFTGAVNKDYSFLLINIHPH